MIFCNILEPWISLWFMVKWIQSQGNCFWKAKGGVEYE